MVTAYGRAHRYPLPLSSIVEQIFLITNSAGWGTEDDCAVLRLYLLGRGNIRSGSLADVKPASTSSVTVKTIKDLLVGVHLAATAEIVSFAQILGISSQLLYEVIKDAAGTNKIFMLAYPQMQSHGSGSITAVPFSNKVGDSLVRSTFPGILFPLLLPAYLFLGVEKTGRHIG
jgi:3-hydroxyisobutyrate dehydrogenase